MFQKIIGKRFLVKVIEDTNTTASGIVLSEVPRPTRGEVVQIGSSVGVDFEHIGIGTVVLFGKFSGDLLRVDGNDYLVLDTKEIMATIEDDSDSVLGSIERINQRMSEVFEDLISQGERESEDRGQEERNRYLDEKRFKKYTAPVKPV